MILGIISDTHDDKMNAIPHIMKEFIARKVETIVHCGDIDPKHLDPKLFANLPVDCALIEEQIQTPKFNRAPNGWRFTKPGDRILQIDNYTKIYLGHKVAFKFMTGSEAELISILNLIRKDNDGVRYLFTGHTHHQIYKQDHLINFINPGAVENSYDGYEFATLDTLSSKIVFSRILPTNPDIEPFKVGVISDSFNIAKLDPEFWETLASAFERQDIKHVIHCGNIDSKNIPEEEFERFEVYYYLRKDQREPKTISKNWHLVEAKFPVVEINGYRFCIQLELGADLLEKSEYDLFKLSLDLRKSFPEINFVLFGLTKDAFLEENEQLRFINPGDIVTDRSFATIELPQNEITFDHICTPSLPEPI